MSQLVLPYHIVPFGSGVFGLDLTSPSPGGSSRAEELARSMIRGETSIECRLKVSTKNLYSHTKDVTYLNLSEESYYDEDLEAYFAFFKTDELSKAFFHIDKESRINTKTHLCFTEGSVESTLRTDLFWRKINGTLFSSESTLTRVMVRDITEEDLMPSLKSHLSNLGINDIPDEHLVNQVKEDVSQLKDKLFVIESIRCKVNKED